MHLLESQSSQAAQLISNIEIYEKYFPLSFDKYIVIGPYSKDSKNHDLYNDVLTILLPILEKENIKVVQIGAANEKPLKGTYCLAGQTSINQVAYIIKNSLLFFGADSYGQHLAGHYDIPLVDLIVNNYSECVKPYFGTPSHQIILEPPRDPGEKPSFSLQEQPKSVNKIKVEDIAASVCKLLNLPFDFPYQSLYLGNIYINGMIISSCDAVVNPQQFGLDTMIMDLTYNFSEEILMQQLQVSNCAIICDKPLSDKILNFNIQTKRIKELVYEIKEDSSPEFVKSSIRAGIPTRMISDLTQDKINDLKLHYLEYGVIWQRQKFNPLEIDEFKNENLDNLYFKSSKFILGKGKVFNSKAHYLVDIPVESFDDIIKIQNNEHFWTDLQSFRILKKIS